MATATASPPNPFVVEASDSGGSGEVPSEGVHPAVLIGLVGLGTFTESYQNKEYTTAKVMFVFELSNEMKADGDPHVLGFGYNLPPKLSKKSNLRKLIEQWRGKAMADTESLDMMKMLGAACQMNLAHAKSSNDKTYAKMLGVMPLPKGMAAPKPWNETFAWSRGMGDFHPPAWMPYLYGRPVEEVIADSHEAKGTLPAAKAAAEAGGPSEDNDDGIPF